MSVVVLYRRLLPRKKLFLLSLALAFALCAVLAARLPVREDILALVPTRPPSLAERFDYLRGAPFMRIISITVGPAAGDANGPVPAGDTALNMAEGLAGRLAATGLFEVSDGPGGASGPDLPQKLFARAPSLLGAAEISTLAGGLDRESIRAALKRDRELLLSPSGLGLRSLVALDPFGLRSALFRKLASLSRPGGFESRGGRFVDASGRYALVLARPAASMADVAASDRIMNAVRQALAGLPADAASFVSASYRHTEANAAMIKADLGRVLPLSFALVAALFFVFLRRRAALLILAVPVCAVGAATAVTGLAYSGISGIVVAFGSVLLGITSDYAVHAYYAVSGARDVEKGLKALAPPLFAGAATTAAGFAALLLSDIPAISQMAVFALVGIAAALLSALSIPLLLAPGKESEPAEAASGGASPGPAAGAFRLLPGALLAGLLLLGIACCFLTLTFDGDIRSLSYTPPAAASDEEKTREIWGAARDSSLIVAPGGPGEAGFEEALQINERIWDLLRAFGRTDKAHSIAPLLPSAKSQAESRAAWEKLWSGPEGLAALADLEALAPEAGFAPSAFAPFKALTGESPAVTPETLRALGAGMLLEMFITRDSGRSLIYTALSDGRPLEQGQVAAIERAGGRVVSGAVFRAEMAEAAGSDIFRFCSLTLAATVLVVLVLFRSPARALPVLLPMLAAFAATLAMFRVAGIAMNMFHAVALPLVIALSVDYGIFMQAALEGGIDKNGRKAVALSALTTLAGFGSLLLAGHPALFSLGLTVSGGISAAMLVAVWLLPKLMRRGG